MKPPFDAPPEIGTLVASATWREPNSPLPRGMASCGVGLFAWAALDQLSLALDRGPMPAGLVFAAVIAALSYAFVILPFARCACIGTLGVSRSRRALGTTREVLRFADVDDVEVTYTRVLSDATHEVYAHTQARYSWRAKDGREVFVINAVFAEPGQREWDPTAPTEVPALDKYTLADPLRFASDAVTAFRASQDRRERAPFR